MILENDVGIFENFMPKDLCLEQIQNFERGVTLGLSQPREGLLQIEDEAIVIELIEEEQWEKWKPFVEFFQLAWEKYSKEYLMLKNNNNIYDLKHIKIQKTLPGQGYHQWHDEHTYYHNGNSKGIDLRIHSYRVATWILYLNDEFEAGETELLHKHMRIKPETGKLIIFPCNYPYAHRGNPPIGNAKYILTGWVYSN